MPAFLPCGPDGVGTKSQSGNRVTLCDLAARPRNKDKLAFAS